MFQICNLSLDLDNRFSFEWNDLNFDTDKLVPFWLSIFSYSEASSRTVYHSTKNDFERELKIKKIGFIFLTYQRLRGGGRWEAIRPEWMWNIFISIFPFFFRSRTSKSKSSRTSSEILKFEPIYFEWVRFERFNFFFRQRVQWNKET